MSILSILSLESAAALTVVTDNAKSHGFTARSPARRRRHPSRGVERSHSDDGLRLFESPQKHSHHHRRRMSSDGSRYHMSRWESDSSLRGRRGTAAPCSSTARRESSRSLPPSSPTRNEQPQHHHASLQQERRRSEMPTRWESIPTIPSHASTDEASPTPIRKRYDSVPTLPTKSDQPPVPKAREITIMNTLARNPSPDLQEIAERLAPSPYEREGQIPDMDTILAKALDADC